MQIKTEWKRSFEGQVPTPGNINVTQYLALSKTLLKIIRR